MIRFKIDQANAAKEVTEIFSSSATNKWLGHYGSRIVFDKNKKIFLSIGEGGSTSYGGESSPNQNAQNLTEAWGKIHRLNEDGSTPSDNPKLGVNGSITSIYSYGHRNPQGLAYDPIKDELWETEHGPKGGDELNKVIKSNNYGWPLVSYGVNYDGKIISASPTKTGITPPTHYWTPSIGACGLTIINSDKYGTWRRQFLAGGLALQYLSKLKIDADTKVTESKLLNTLGRIRDVQQAPDGYVYVSVENPGRIIKLVPNF